MPDWLLEPGPDLPLSVEDIRALYPSTSSTADFDALSFGIRKDVGESEESDDDSSSEEGSLGSLRDEVEDGVDERSLESLGSGSLEESGVEVEERSLGSKSLGEEVEVQEERDVASSASDYEEGEMDDLGREEREEGTSGSPPPPPPTTTVLRVASPGIESLQSLWDDDDSDDGDADVEDCPDEEESIHRHAIDDVASGFYDSDDDDEDCVSVSTATLHDLLPTLSPLHSPRSSSPLLPAPSLPLPPPPPSQLQPIASTSTPSSTSHRTFFKSPLLSHPTPTYHHTLTTLSLSTYTLSSSPFSNPDFTQMLTGIDDVLLRTPYEVYHDMCYNAVVKKEVLNGSRGIRRKPSELEMVVEHDEEESAKSPVRERAQYDTDEGEDGQEEDEEEELTETLPLPLPIPETKGEERVERSPEGATGYGDGEESGSEDEDELISPIQSSEAPSVWVRNSKTSTLGHERHHRLGSADGLIPGIPSLSLSPAYHRIDSKRISLSPDPHAAASVACLFLQSAPPYNSTFSTSTSPSSTSFPSSFSYSTSAPSWKRRQTSMDIGSFPIHTPPPSSASEREREREREKEKMRMRTSSVSVKGLFNLKGWRERVQSASFTTNA